RACSVSQCSAVQQLDSLDKAKVIKENRSRKADSDKSRASSESEPGWNLYIINTVSTIQLYIEMVFLPPASVVD
ncbi:UNVERIFIED_CONTAM: hypothetical protein H355_011927, partial [Colinus virginianus]